MSLSALVELGQSLGIELDGIRDRKSALYTAIVNSAIELE